MATKANLVNLESPESLDPRASTDNPESLVPQASKETLDHRILDLLAHQAFREQRERAVDLGSTESLAKKEEWEYPE